MFSQRIQTPAQKPASQPLIHEKRHAATRGFAILTVVAVSILTAAFPNTARSQTSSSTDPHTQAAVIAADEAWDKAESSANTNYIDALLLPEYRSISSDGSVHDKAAILAGARKNAPERAAAVDKWRAAHPHVTSVLITGDTAVLTFALDKPGPKLVMSCDIFVYQDGRWRALYSQHSEASK